MARVLMLDFIDNDEAEQFILDVQKYKKNPAPNSEGKGFEVIGLFARPTLFCDPTNGHLKSLKKTERGFVRGLKWGWWVCNGCHKPTRAYGSHIQTVVASATNLLSVFLEEHIKEDTTLEQIEEFKREVQQRQAETRMEAIVVPVEGTSRGVALYGDTRDVEASNV